MEPAVAHRNVHTECKQYQRNCPQICVLASSVDWAPAPTTTTQDHKPSATACRLKATTVAPLPHRVPIVASNTRFALSCNTEPTPSMFHLLNYRRALCERGIGRYRATQDERTMNPTDGYCQPRINQHQSLHQGIKDLAGWPQCVPQKSTVFPLAKI